MFHREWLSKKAHNWAARAATDRRRPHRPPDVPGYWQSWAAASTSPVEPERSRRLANLGAGRAAPVTASRTGRDPMKTLDLITIGRSSVDLYGSQIGGRLEDMGRSQVHRRLADQHRLRHGAAGAEVRGDLPRRRRAYGPLHQGAARARGGGTRGVKIDPERLTALVLLGIRDRAIPADLLSRELRRHGALRRRHRPRVHSPARASRHRNPLSHPAQRPPC